MNHPTARRLLHVTSILALSGLMACGRANTRGIPGELAKNDSAQNLEQMLAVLDSVEAEAVGPRAKLLASKHGLDAEQVRGLIEAYRQATGADLRAMLSGEPLPKEAPFDLTAAADQVGIPVPVAADILLWFELLTKRCDAGE